MKRILALGLLVASFALITSCGGSSKKDTTAQLYNDTTVNGGAWAVTVSVGGSSLVSTTGSWSPKTKMANCGTQTATFSTPDGTSWRVDGVNIQCEKHNLLTLFASGGSPALKWTTGSDQ